MSLPLGASMRSQAEEEPARTRFSVFFGYNAGLTTQHESFSWSKEIYFEDAHFDLSYSAKTRNSFSAGLGYLFSDHVGIEIGIDSGPRRLGVDYSASIPHPLHFNSPRAAQGSAGYQGRENIGFLNLVLGFPFWRFRLDLSGGPAYFVTDVELIKSIGYTESYPYSSVTLSLTTERTRRRVFGFNVGASLTLNLFRNLGIFAMVKSYSARSDFATAESLNLRLSLGGFKAGGGFKILF